jgi:hypothetical protein
LELVRAGFALNCQRQWEFRVSIDA